MAKSIFLKHINFINLIALSFLYSSVINSLVTITTCGSVSMSALIMVDSRNAAFMSEDLFFILWTFKAAKRSISECKEIHLLQQEIID